MVKRYKFLREGLKSNSGDIVWEIGKWQHEDKIDMCNSGFHCSKQIQQAFSFVQGEILAEVEVKGKSDKQDDKEVYTDMRIFKAYKWQKKDSVALSIYAAELCIKNYEKVYPNDDRPRKAIEAAKAWLENPTKENESAAGSAARSAWSAESARSAAGSAESAGSAGSAAESAERSAAGSARSAAESAERSAWSAAESARSALVEKIENWFVKRISKLEKYK